MPSREAVEYLDRVLEIGLTRSHVTQWYDVFQNVDSWRRYLTGFFRAQSNSPRTLIMLHKRFNRLPSESIRLMSRGSIANLTRGIVRDPSEFARCIKLASCTKDEYLRFLILGDRRRLLQMRIGLTMQTISLILIGFRNSPSIYMPTPIFSNFFCIPGDIQENRKGQGYLGYRRFEAKFRKAFDLRKNPEYKWMVGLASDHSNIGEEMFMSLMNYQMEST